MLKNKILGDSLELNSLCDFLEEPYLKTVIQVCINSNVYCSVCEQPAYNVARHYLEHNWCDYLDDYYDTFYENSISSIDLLYYFNKYEK